jgi:iron complex outermembrane recepter protein
MKKLLGISCLAMLAFPVYAAEDDEQGTDQMEEIIVSATYRDTRLMDTPLTISAVTEEDIMLKGIEDIQTLYQSIPGLSYRTNSQTYNTLSVRGLTPPTGGGASMVGVYMDNLPMTDSNSGGLSQSLGALFDMERVEVLKGPQGTLYGEGNMGGSIRYISNKPDTSGWDYAIQTSLENISASDDLSYRVDAMVNIPLGEELALRLVGYRRDKAGIIDQVAPRNKKDTDTNVENGYRARLTWYPTEKFELTGMVNVIDGEYGGPGLGFHCFTESTPSDPNGQVPVYDLPGTTCAGQTDQFDNSDPYVTHLGHPTHQSGGFDDQEMYNISFEWELSFANLIGSSSYFERATDYSEETSPRFSVAVVGFVNNLFCFGALTVCGPNKLATLGGDGSFFRGSERDVHEFRLISNTDSALQWTVGAYFKDDESQGGHHKGCYKGGSPAYASINTHCWLQYGFFPDVPVADQGEIIQWLNGLIPGNTSYKTSKEKSIYGEASYRINDQWEVLLGLRAAEVEYQLDVARPGVDSRDNPVNSLKTTSDITSPKVTVTWRPKEDVMAYATYSQGFRPGIVNTGLATKVAELDAVRAGDPVAEAHYQRVFGNQTVDGDEVVNYELGLKATLMDGRLSLTSALYHVDWNDTIISVSDEITDVAGVSPLSYSYAINGGTAESEGLELEIRYAISDNLHLTVGGDRNWTAEIGSAGDARYGGVAIQPGNRLANAPKYSAYGSLAYSFDLYGMDASARADAYIIAESWNTANNERPAPAYETLDLKLLVNRDNWQASIYVRNVFDEEIVYEFNQVGYRFGRPRTYGVQLNYRM